MPLELPPHLPIQMTYMSIKKMSHQQLNPFKTKQWQGKRTPVDIHWVPGMYWLMSRILFVISGMNTAVPSFIHFRLDNFLIKLLLIDIRDGTNSDMMWGWSVNKVLNLEEHLSQSTDSWSELLVPLGFLGAWPAQSKQIPHSHLSLQAWPTKKDVPTHYDHEDPKE